MRDRNNVIQVSKHSTSMGNQLIMKCTMHVLVYGQIGSTRVYNVLGKHVFEVREENRVNSKVRVSTNPKSGLHKIIPTRKL